MGKIQSNFNNESHDSEIGLNLSLSSRCNSSDSKLIGKQCVDRQDLNFIVQWSAISLSHGAKGEFSAKLRSRLLRDSGESTVLPAVPVPVPSPGPGLLFSDTNIGDRLNPVPSFELLSRSSRYLVCMYSNSSMSFLMCCLLEKVDVR